jgi:hypothetical protein
MKTCKRKYLKHEKRWEYKATDKNGYTFYYTEKPITVYYNLGVWHCENGIYSPIGISNKVASGKKDWEKSLRKIKD